jgi:hypothetical protein
MLEHAHQSGHDVAEVTQRLVNERPLDELPGEDLRYRIAASLPLKPFDETWAAEPPGVAHRWLTRSEAPPNLSPDREYDRSTGPEF